MPKLSLRPHKQNKSKTIKVFFEPYIFDDVISVLNKIIDPIINPSIKKRWLTYSNSLLPKNNLGYSSQEDYLKTTMLEEKDIVENTILHIFPDMPKLDIKYLTKEFMIFTKKAHILIFHLKGKDLPIYREIYHSLIYIKNIKETIRKNNKVRSSSHLGIKHSSKWKALIKSELNTLKYRLNHPYFPITNEEEIEKTKLQISYLEKAIDADYKIIVDLFHFANIQFGLDYPLLKQSKKDQIYIGQLLNLLNGFRTSNEEFITSVMIFLRLQSNITNKNDYQNLSKSILNIVIQFFTDIYLKNSKKRAKRTNHFTYNFYHVDQQIRIKTFIDNIPIYGYSQSNYFNFISEIYNLSLKSFQGEHNILEQDLPIKNESSEFTTLKNLAKIKQDFNLTKREIKSLFTIIDISSQDNEKILNLFINM